MSPYGPHRHNLETERLPTTVMKKTPRGTSVGVEDPYAVVDRCDHVTDDGRCRFAIERAEADPEFALARRRDDFQCHVLGDVEDRPDWRDCRHFRSLDHARECRRCGIEERRVAHSDARPLLEAHHLSYPTEETGHEITVYLCRWCHASVHDSWGRIDDDVTPDPEAIAAAEGRRAREAAEFSFSKAIERYDVAENDPDDGSTG